jgi:hypothetical protein
MTPADYHKRIWEPSFPKRFTSSALQGLGPVSGRLEATLKGNLV